MRYYKSEGGPVTAEPTKWDSCLIVATEHPYNFQAGSGRSEVLKLVEAGQTIGQLTKLAADKGYSTKFTIGALLRHVGGAKPSFVVEPVGQTIAGIKAFREPRKVSAEELAARDEREALKQQKKAERAAENKARLDKMAEEKAERLKLKSEAVAAAAQVEADKKQARIDERAARAAAREADKERKEAERAAAAELRAKAKAEREANAGSEPEQPRKGKRRKVVDGEENVEAAVEAQVAA